MAGAESLSGVEASDLQFIVSTINRHLDQPIKIYAFSSRVDGGFSPGSVWT